MKTATRTTQRHRATVYERGHRPPRYYGRPEYDRSEQDYHYRRREPGLSRGEKFKRAGALLAIAALGTLAGAGVLNYYNNASKEIEHNTAPEVDGELALQTPADAANLVGPNERNDNRAVAANPDARSGLRGSQSTPGDHGR